MQKVRDEDFRIVARKAVPPQNRSSVPKCLLLSQCCATAVISPPAKLAFHMSSSHSSHSITDPAVSTTWPKRLGPAIHVRDRMKLLALVCWTRGQKISMSLHLSLSNKSINIKKRKNFQQLSSNKAVSENRFPKLFNPNFLCTYKMYILIRNMSNMN